MASRRKLKKNLRYTFEQLYFICAFTAPTDEKEEQNELIDKLFFLHQDAISRISHTEKKNAKAYYKKLLADVNVQIDEIFDRLS